MKTQLYADQLRPLHMKGTSQSHKSHQLFQKCIITSQPNIISHGVYLPLYVSPKGDLTINWKDNINLEIIQYQDDARRAMYYNNVFPIAKLEPITSSIKYKSTVSKFRQCLMSNDNRVCL